MVLIQYIKFDITTSLRREAIGQGFQLMETAEFSIGLSTLLL